jgi:stage II sporulation protein M
MKNKKSKPKSIRNHYHDALDTINLSRKCIYFGIGTFVLFMIIGFIFPLFFIETITNIMKELSLDFQGLSIYETMFKIFLNNSLVSFVTILFGILIGIFPLMASIQNGYLVGFVANKAVAVNGFSVLWRLLPHGIFELPAIFISIGLGLKLGEKVLRRNKPLRFLREALKVFFLIVLPLLVIAAIIEGLLIGLGI